MKGGVLAVWVDAAPESEAEFNAWYTAEHVPERVGIPGFLSGARYRAVSGTPRYLAWYATDDVGVLASAAYLDRLNHPTDWTRRIMPSFRNTVRSIFEVRATCGRGRGGIATTIRLAPAAETARPGVEWIEREVLPGLCKLDGIVGAQLWTAAGGPQAPTSETALRGADAVCPAAVLIEAADVEPARHACGEWLSAERLREAGIRRRARTGVYRLLYALEGG